MDLYKVCSLNLFSSDLSALLFHPLRGTPSHKWTFYSFFPITFLIAPPEGKLNHYCHIKIIGCLLIANTLNFFLNNSQKHEDV